MTSVTICFLGNKGTAPKNHLGRKITTLGSLNESRTSKPTSLELSSAIQFSVTTEINTISLSDILSGLGWIPITRTSLAIAPLRCSTIYPDRVLFLVRKEKKWFLRICGHRGLVSDGAKMKWREKQLEASCHCGNLNGFSSYSLIDQNK
eukprot:scaffold8917_cov111-Cylindrotheca_fusiformis.AAC.4